MKRNKKTIRQIVNFSSDDVWNDIDNWLFAPTDNNFDYFNRNLDYHIKNSSDKEKKRLTDIKALLKLAYENTNKYDEITDKGKDLIKNFMNKNGIQPPKSYDDYNSFLPFSRMVTKKKLDPKYDKEWYEEQLGGFVNELLSNKENEEIYFNEQADKSTGIPSVIEAMKSKKIIK